MTRCNFRNKSGSSWEEKTKSFLPLVLLVQGHKISLRPCHIQAFAHLLGLFSVSLPSGECNDLLHEIAGNSTGQHQLHFCLFCFCVWLLLLACMETPSTSETRFGLSPKTLQMSFNFTFTLIKWQKFFPSFLPTSSVPLLLSKPNHK